jgi:hypothetical protein
LGLLTFKPPDASFDMPSLIDTVGRLSLSKCHNYKLHTCVKLSATA